MTVPAAAPGSGPIAPAPPRAAPQPPTDRSAFGAVLELASQRAGEGRRPCRRRTAAVFQRIVAREGFARRDGPSLVAQRQRPLGLFAVCLAGRVEHGRALASRRQIAPAGASCQIRGERRLHRRWRQGGDCRAIGWRTRLSLGRLYLRRRHLEPHARGQRAGLRLRRGRQPCATRRSKGRKRPRGRLGAR